MRIRSLYAKFAATTIGIMIVSFLLAFFISNTYYQHYLKPDNDAKNTEIAQNISIFIEANPQMDIGDYLDNVADVGINSIWRTVIQKAASTVRSSGKPPCPAVRLKASRTAMCTTACWNSRERPL